VSKQRKQDGHWNIHRGTETNTAIFPNVQLNPSLQFTKWGKAAAILMLRTVGQKTGPCVLLMKTGALPRLWQLPNKVEAASTKTLEDEDVVGVCGVAVAWNLLWQAANPLVASVLPVMCPCC